MRFLSLQEQIRFPVSKLGSNYFRIMYYQYFFLKHQFINKGGGGHNWIYAFNGKAGSWKGKTDTFLVDQLVEKSLRDSSLTQRRIQDFCEVGVKLSFHRNFSSN